MKKTERLKLLRSFDDEKLKAELRSLMQLSFTLRMQKFSDRLTKSDLIKSARKDIARVKTLLSERQDK